MELETLKTNLNYWNEVRNTPIGFELLNSGMVIEVTRANYLKLFSKNSQYLHLYIGVEKGLPKDNLGFYLIAEEYDNIDSIEEHLDKIIPLSFKQAPYFSSPSQSNQNLYMQTRILDCEAWSRAFRWSLFKKDWFTDFSSQEAIVKAFRIPNDSLIDIFKEQENCALLFFGIANFTPNNMNNNTIGSSYNIDIVVCNSVTHEFELPFAYSNLTTPCPPYHCAEFSLFDVLE